MAAEAMTVVSPPSAAGNDASPKVSPKWGQIGCCIWLALFPAG